MKETLVEIAVALILAKLVGTLFEKVKQPSVLGAIFAGVIISAIIFMGDRFDVGLLGGFGEPTYDVLSRIGIIMLLFLSGMEMEVGDIKRIGGEAGPVAWFGVLIPFFLGVGLGYFLGYKLIEALVMGAILTATSVGITARALMDMNALRSEASQVILNAAVIDDILGILIITMVLGTGKPVDVLGFKVAPFEYLILGMLAFFFVVLYLGSRYIGRLMAAISWLTTPKAVASVTIALCFIISAVARWVNLAEITGAFLAGILVGKTVESRRVADDMKSIGYAFFIPLFFVGVGVSIDFDVFSTITLPAVMFIGIALLGKIMGCGIGGILGGMEPHDSIRVGIGMMPRMEVALVVVAAAMANPNFIAAGHANEILAMTVLLVVVSTFLTPTLLKSAFEVERYW